MKLRIEAAPLSFWEIVHDAVVVVVLGSVILIVIGLCIPFLEAPRF